MRPYDTVDVFAGIHFNSRTHVECDCDAWISGNYGTNFNSRTHVECDVDKFTRLCYNVHFNSRTHVECDPANPICSLILQIFQLTHSRGVRLSRWFSTLTNEKFQLTHSRGVRLEKLDDYTVIDIISTHALTWSATLGDVPCRMIGFISTHALTWSATRCRYKTGHLWARFQLTHSRGVRPGGSSATGS